MSIAKFTLVALDCPDPLALAKFYVEVVGGTIREDPNAQDWVRVLMPSGCDLGFQQKLDYQEPNWPDGVPQQLHLDFDVTDLDAAEAAVLAVGARKAAVQPSPSEWRVFLDPVGHPFCLIQR
jgi:predicted enzyme related to lactoylglutathione lyase